MSSDEAFTTTKTKEVHIGTDTAIMYHLGINHARLDTIDDDVNNTATGATRVRERKQVQQSTSGRISMIQTLYQQ